MGVIRRRDSGRGSARAPPALGDARARGAVRDGGGGVAGEEVASSGGRPSGGAAGRRVAWPGELLADEPLGAGTCRSRVARPGELPVGEPLAPGNCRLTSRTARGVGPGRRRHPGGCAPRAGSCGSPTSWFRRTAVISPYRRRVRATGVTAYGRLLTVSTGDRAGPGLSAAGVGVRPVLGRIGVPIRFGPCSPLFARSTRGHCPDRCPRTPFALAPRRPHDPAQPSAASFGLSNRMPPSV